MRVFSFGGGVQSNAALVLAVQGKIDFKTFLFANVGADSENPDTLKYVSEVSKPYAERNGIELIEVSRKTRDGETLYQRTLREDRSIHIPVMMKSGAPGIRDCTIQFKREVIRRWLPSDGGHVVGLGISLDEFQRMHTNSGQENIVNEYPLINLRLSRMDCLKIIRDAGLPQPPKSSCWFCPYHRMSEWRDMRHNKPELFQKACELEDIINEKRKALGKDRVFLTSKGRPLIQVIGDQPPLFEEDLACESGYCMV